MIIGMHERWMKEKQFPFWENNGLSFVYEHESSWSNGLRVMLGLPGWN